MNVDLARRVGAFLLLAAVLLFGPTLYAQVADAIATTPPQVPDATANEWGGTLIWAFFSATGLESLKKAEKFSLITEQTTTLVQRALGIALAAAAAVGVHYTYDATAGRLVIDGLTLTGIWTMFTETVRTWVVQELTYRAAIKGRV
jgi:hypothetical protein